MTIMTRGIAHYYGDTVRKLFVAAALIMVVTLPFVAKDIGQTPILPLSFTILTGVAAGLTSPRQPWTAIFNVGVAALGVFSFEWYAVDWYSARGTDNLFFWTNQILGVIFLLALYYSLKTIRRAGDPEVRSGIKRRRFSFWDSPPSDDGGDA